MVDGSASAGRVEVQVLFRGCVAGWWRCLPGVLSHDRMSPLPVAFSNECGGDANVTQEDVRRGAGAMMHESDWTMLAHGAAMRRQ